MIGNAPLIAVSVFISSFIMGFSGFGFAIVAISLMSFCMPIREIIPFIFIYNMLVNLVLLIQLRAHFNMNRVGLQIFGFMPGALIGIICLSHMRDITLKYVVGYTLIAFSIWSLMNRNIKIGIHKRFWSGLSGFAAGILGGAVYMPGPPVIIYNSLTRKNRFEFKVDLQVFFLLANLYLFGAYMYLGLFSIRLLLANMFFSPFIMAGFGIGVLAFFKIKDIEFKKYTEVLLGVMGILLVLKTALMK